MRVNRLAVKDWRNIEQIIFKPGPGLNVICGENGQGKTNLLEAVWMLTGAKSFRPAKDAQLIRAGRAFSLLDAEVESALGNDHILLTVGGSDTPRPGRTARLNGGDVGRASALAGRFGAVVFQPDDLSLVKGSPEGRRRFLDAALCQLYPGYLATLRRYTRLVSQKNSLLKHWNRTPGADLMCDAFDMDLAVQGEEIVRRRREYLEKLGPIATQNYAEISSERENLSVRYQGNFQPGKLAERIRATRREDRMSGCCTVGPHREDMELLLKGFPARQYASQGQQRSAVLSLKLAEACTAAAITGQQPVMLLDDVLSELDEGRQNYLLTRMQKGQTIVTACDPGLFEKTSGRVFRMEAGRITAL
ncbi:recombination protein F [gut metagenome]|uniref:DNA replication and repair protein RecF n=1 Tax=gut metagenome TaxID=749906 RepID=J9GPL7_9ZZZZ